MPMRTSAYYCCLFFFFKQKTAYEMRISDWSSDVCSSDLYIIRNGGNTRLAILRELWSETKEERFFRIACLFRPWPARGEIVALTGHLAENELRGGLTFIERALGIEKARAFYEQESGKALSDRKGVVAGKRWESSVE